MGKLLNFLTLVNVDRLSSSLVKEWEAHGISASNHVIVRFEKEIEKHLKNQGFNLRKANPSDENLIEAIIKWKSIVQCRESHTEGGYYAGAEAGMEWQWENVIFPVISDFDFTEVVEIAAGHGRNTNRLTCLSKTIHVVDVNSTCVEACRKRFGRRFNGCRMFYHVTSGNSLSFIKDSSITTVYSFDSMVHFDKFTVRDYVDEIFRILSPGGRAFLHHSNLGTEMPNSDWANNEGNRSDMTAALMAEFASRAGLKLAFQRLSGKNDGWGRDDLDCLSVLEK